MVMSLINFCLVLFSVLYNLIVLSYKSLINLNVSQLQKLTCDRNELSLSHAEPGSTGPSLGDRFLLQFFSIFIAVKIWIVKSAIHSHFFLFCSHLYFLNFSINMRISWWLLQVSALENVVLMDISHKITDPVCWTWLFWDKNYYFFPRAMTKKKSNKSGSSLSCAWGTLCIHIHPQAQMLSFVDEKKMWRLVSIKYFIPSIYYLHG